MRTPDGTVLHSAHRHDYVTHTDTPIEETIKSCIEQYIMQGFDEYFEFNPEDIE